jgi:hypothetical protein
VADRSVVFLLKSSANLFGTPVSAQQLFNFVPIFIRHPKACFSFAAIQHKMVGLLVSITVLALVSTKLSADCRLVDADLVCNIAIGLTSFVQYIDNVSLSWGSWL